ncbi:MAG: hypothetical protein FH761_17465 [Firmicutes bacterium]|nr:hypothetical protein [Bacillota bacterium]
MQISKGVFELESGRISAFQLSFLVISTVISTIDIFFPAYVAQDAMQDSWITVIITTIATFISIAIYFKLAFRYPNKTIFQYSCDILGKPLGKIVGIVYIHHILIVASSVARDFSSLYVSAFNPQAPIVIYHIMMVLLAGYTVWLGIEVLARTNDILLPIGILVLGIVVALKMPTLNFMNFLPIMYHGIKPALKGSIVLYGIMLDSIICLQLIPFVKDKKNIKKNIYISIIFLGFALEMGVLAIALFGPLTEKFIFPALMYVRLTPIGDFIENLEITILGIWIAGVFVKLTIFYYFTVLGIAQVFNFKNYKFLIIPVGITIIVFATTAVDRIATFFHITHYVHPIIAATMGIIIPAILLVIVMIKEKIKGSTEKAS